MNDRLFIKGSTICCQDLSLLDDYGLAGCEADKHLLPAGLRRRTSLTTQMAVTAATMACEQAGADAEHLPSVFASVGGEIQVTDALCKTLPDINELLSPTQFHNSVHNTTAGYWGILKKCQAPATAIAAVDDTFAMGLLEAWSQLQQNKGDILLVCYDEEWPQYLAPPMGKIPFACALVISNDCVDEYQYSISAPGVESNKSELSENLVEFIRSAPAAACIPLLQAIKQVKNIDYIPLNINGARWYTKLQKV